MTRRRQPKLRYPRYQAPYLSALTEAGIQISKVHLFRVKRRAKIRFRSRFSYQSSSAGQNNLAAQ